MSTEENRALIQRLSDELWDRRNTAIIDELFAPAWVDHDAQPGLPPGRDGLKALATGIHAAFSDGRSTIEDVVAEGDKIVWRWSYQATQTGDFMGIPATGKRVTLSGITIDRIEDGRFKERWSVTDTLGFLQQLGAIPAPQGT